jgi:hypothetical protein
MAALCSPQHDRSRRIEAEKSKFALVSSKILPRLLNYTILKSYVRLVPTCEELIHYAAYQGL